METGFIASTGKRKAPLQPGVVCVFNNAALPPVLYWAVAFKTHLPPLSLTHKERMTKLPGIKLVKPIDCQAIDLEAPTQKIHKQRMVLKPY